MVTDALDLLFEALALPEETRVEQRVAKALLVERGELARADRRLVEAGLDRLTWRATIKPSAVGLAAYADETRDYPQLVVMAAMLRPGAKMERLVEVIHRAIAHPLVLLSGSAEAGRLSIGLKRRHERGGGRVVLDRLALSPVVTTGAGPLQTMFLESLALAHVAAHNLWSLHMGWEERAEALAAAHFTGTFRLLMDEAEIAARRAALREYTDMARQSAALRRAAAVEKRLPRRLELAREIANAEARLAKLVEQMR